MIALVADIGGTRIKLGLVRDGEIVARRTEPARAEMPLGARLDELASTWRELCAVAWVPPEAVDGIGVAFPSVVDPERGRILDEWGKFPGCTGFDFAGWAAKEYRLPIVLENDSRAALVGEWRRGAGRGCESVVMLTLGTGIGSAAIMQGRVLRGAHGQAGILGGHLTVRYGGRPCVCGNLGCAEAEASTAVLHELAAARPDFAASGLAREDRIDFAAVFRLAAAGDACARALRDHSLGVWSSAAVNAIHAYDPERLILGGGIMASSSHILPPLREYVRRHAHTAWGAVEVAPCALGDDAALHGCACLIAEKSVS
jgi:glucokinase